MIMKTLLDVIDALESRNPLDRIRDLIKVDFEERRIGNVPYIKALYEGGGNKRVEVLGRLGAIQMSQFKGLVSDADGAIIALTVLAELKRLEEKGIKLNLDVSFVTNVALNAKLIPHKPFDFMVPEVGLDDALKEEVDPKASFIISIDSTKGNRLAKFDDFALTHVVLNGYILRVSDEVVDIYNRVTGHEVYLVSLTTGDLTPLDFNVYHISTLISPWLYTTSPVLGIATVSKQMVPGYATGVMDLNMLERASRFIIELLKHIGLGGKVYDEREYEELVKKLGDSNLRKVQRVK